MGKLVEAQRQRADLNSKKKRKRKSKSSKSSNSDTSSSSSSNSDSTTSDNDDEDSDSDTDSNSSSSTTSSGDEKGAIKTMPPLNSLGGPKNLKSMTSAPVGPNTIGLVDDEDMKYPPIPGFDAALAATAPIERVKSPMEVQQEEDLDTIFNEHEEYDFDGQNLTKKERKQLEKRQKSRRKL